MMTWLEFNDAVRVYLATHNRRQGIQALIDTLIKAALIDLQSAVPSLQQGHTTIYPPARFVTDGMTGRAHYPVNSLITSVYSRDPVTFAKIADYVLATTPGEVIEMTLGVGPICSPRISIEPQKGLFHVAPNPVEGLYEIVMVWTGTKTDYEADDLVPFDDACVLAVSEFVWARLARTVDNDIEMARSYAATYAGTKRRIKADANEAKNMKIHL